MITDKYRKHRGLIWMLAKMDFKLRYQDSILGYLWAILKPLALFFVLNFVFTSVFARVDQSVPYYSLQLLVALMMFTFFAEGTSSAMNALKSRSQLVTKIYVPRWILIVSSTVHSSITYGINIMVIISFFLWYQFLPSILSIFMFFILSAALYLLILSFGLVVAPLMLKYKDLVLIWEVALRVLFYATPILYPLQMLPEWSHKLMLISPVTFIIHFTKESMFSGHYANFDQYAIFISIVILTFLISLIGYKKFEPRSAEFI